MLPKYDTKQGIETYLKDGLAGFHQLAKDRAEAGYKRAERMEEWLVLRVWHFDTCGNLGKITEVTEDNYRVRHASFDELRMTIPDVISTPELWKSIELNGREGRVEPKVSMTTSHGHFLPSAKALCVRCGEPWRLENAGDCVVRRAEETVKLDEHVGKPLKEIRALWDARTDGDWYQHPEVALRNDRWIDLSPVPGFETLKKNERGWVGFVGNARAERDGHAIDPETYVIQPGDEASWQGYRYLHRECNRLDLAERIVGEFREAFDKAGFKSAELRTIPNGYHARECECCAPWVEARTEVGVIVVGWRKRVINIDWSETRRDLKTIFASEDVTKGEHFIHAWGCEKCIEYLGRIRESLLAGVGAN
jgi:hypothetical protein